MNLDKMILDALRESLGEDKYQELLKHLDTQLFGQKANTVIDAYLETTKRLNLGGIRYDNVYYVDCLDADGNLKWQDEAHNIVVDVGLVHTLDVVLYSTAKTTNWYLGLTTGSPTVAPADTMASHGGWTEYQDYSAGTRPQLDFSPGASDLSPSGSSLAAGQISFTITSPGGTVGGAFITDTSTKGGATGLLYGAAAFTGGNKSVSTNDTLNVNVTINATSS